MNNRKLFGLIAVGLVSTAAGFLATGGLDKIKSVTEVTSVTNVPKVTTQVPSPKQEKETEAPDSTSKVIPPDTEKSVPTGNMKVRVSRNPVASANGTYTFSVIASGMPPYTNVVYTFNQGRRGWANSSTGTFTGVAPETRSVTVYALAKRDGQLVAQAETTVTGFDKLPANATADKPKLTVSQVAAMFRSHDSQLLYPDDHRRHPLIAKHVVLSFSGLRSGDVKPQVINDIYDKINFGIWQSANVVSLSYDTDNKVNGIHFSITYPD